MIKRQGSSTTMVKEMPAILYRGIIRRALDNSESWTAGCGGVFICFLNTVFKICQIYC